MAGTRAVVLLVALLAGAALARAQTNAEVMKSYRRDGGHDMDNKHDKDNEKDSYDNYMRSKHDYKPHRDEKEGYKAEKPEHDKPEERDYKHDKPEHDKPEERDYKHEKPEHYKPQHDKPQHDDYERPHMKHNKPGKKSPPAPLKHMEFELAATDAKFAAEQPVQVGSNAVLSFDLKHNVTTVGKAVMTGVATEINGTSFTLNAMITVQSVDEEHKDTSLVAAGLISWDGVNNKVDEGTLVVLGGSGFMTGAEGTLTLAGGKGVDSSASFDLLVPVHKRHDTEDKEDQEEGEEGEGKEGKEGKDKKY